MSDNRLSAASQRWVHQSIRVFASRWCWYGIFALFGLQIVWFIVSARYPMAFDENFHFGLIQLHAQQWLPYFTSQPDHASAFGAVARDPSYLYHWLMSLPYRLIAHFTSDQTVQIITLRFINLPLSLWGLWLMRRLLLRLNISPVLTNLSLLIYTLVPIVPFLGAHISYDNLFIPLTMVALLMTIDWVAAYRLGSVSIIKTLILGDVLLATSLVKYPFLPVMATVLAVMAITVVRRTTWGAYARQLLIASAQQTSRLVVIATIALSLIVGGLFVERYAVNVVRYHTPNPSCASVLNVDECLEYAPWARDYRSEQAKAPTTKPNPLFFAGVWFGGLWYRSFFAISDTYDTRLPLIGPSIVSIATGLLGLYLTVRALLAILRRQPARRIVLLVFVLYVGALFTENVLAYVRTGEPVAINGRYLLPFLSFIIAFVGLGFREIWLHRPAVKTVASIVVLGGFLYGGGMLTFLLRSDDSWYWPGSSMVQINRTARDNAAKVISTEPHDSDGTY